MRFFKYLFTLFFFTLFVAFIAGLLFSWTNIWVPKNSIALFSMYSNSKSQTNNLSNTESPTHIVITRKGFNWHWQRIIPGWTQLMIFSNAAQSYTLNSSFALPKAVAYAATSTRFNTYDFIVDISSTFTYSLDRQKMADYVNTYKTNTAYNTQSIILDSLKKEISFLLEKELSRITNALSTSTFFNDDIKNNIETQLKKYSNSITQDLVQLLPVTIQSFDIKITNKPNFSLYTVIKRTIEEAQPSDPNPTQINVNLPSDFTEGSFSKKTQRLEYYLYFIQELSKIAGKEPQLTELIKIFPPKEIFALE